MLRAIHEIMPDWIVGENVAGILSMVQPAQETEVGSQASLFGESDPVFKRRQQYVVEIICRDLEREGYSVQPVLIPACAVGAPHRRDRVWFIAHRDGTGLQTQRTGQPPARVAGDNPRDAPAHTSGNRDTPCRKSPEMEIGEFALTPYPDSRREESQWPDGFSGLLRDVTGTDAGEVRAARYGREQPGRVNPGMVVRGAGDADTDSTGLERSTYAGEPEEAGKDTAEEQSSRFLCPDWKEFPTQSPVCSRDDGFSARLDGITFSK